MKKISVCRNCKLNYHKNSNVQVFCSKKCKNIYYFKNPPPVVILEKICENCGSHFETKYKKIRFCSLKCSSGYNGKIGKVGGDLVSIKKFIERYGESEGNKKYKEFTQKISNINKGRIGNMVGKRHSTAVKNKISESVKNSEYHKKLIGIHLSAEKKEKISQGCKGIFTIEWFIKKYGKEIGEEKYKKRATIVSKKSYFKIYNREKNKNNYSKVSQKLFWKVYNSIPDLKNEKVYFAELNHEYSCGISHCCFDFVSTNRNKVIEFNGDKFHANPNIFKETDIPNPYLNLSSKDIWELDRLKIEKAVSKGYKVLVIWEEEYKKDINGVIDKCTNFLKE